MELELILARRNWNWIFWELTGFGIGIDKTDLTPCMSLSDAVLPRTDRTFMVANLMRMMTGPGLILTPPARTGIVANLNVGLEQGIESKVRHGKPCKRES